MIVKELDALASQDKFAKAGRTAEEQMAFYLRRAFARVRQLCHLYAIPYKFLRELV
ncbi:MAG TPA: hypothetical protein V6D16_10265 [Candidatus Obscuribacterales bacterium]